MSATESTGEPRELATHAALQSGKRRGSHCKTLAVRERTPFWQPGVPHGETAVHAMFRGGLARSKRRSARYRSYVLSDASTPRWVASAVPDISWQLRRLPIAAGNVTGGDSSPPLERSPRISAAQVELQQRLHLIAGPMSVHAAALIAMGRQAQEALTPLEPTHTRHPRS